MIGSTLLARRAGNHTDTNAIAVNISGTPTKTTGSLAVTPNRNDVMKRASQKATPSPTTMMAIRTRHDFLN